MPSTLSSITDNLASMSWLLPELLIAFTIVILLIVGALFPSAHQLRLSRIVTILGLLAALCSTYWLRQRASCSILLCNELLILDPLASFFRPLFTILTLLPLGLMLWQPSSTDYKRDLSHLLALLSILLGSCLLVMTNHWLMLYLSLALITVATTLLIVQSARGTQRFEASLKYLLSSAVLAAIMLWGISFIYIFTGTFSFCKVALIQRLANLPVAAALMFLTLALSGLLGLIAVFPYHFWLPDVYQGTAAVTTAYLATVPKLAGIAVFSRIFQVFLTQAEPLFVSHLQNFFAFVAYVFQV